MGYTRRTERKRVSAEDVGINRGEIGKENKRKVRVQEAEEQKIVKNNKKTRGED